MNTYFYAVPAQRFFLSLPILFLSLVSPPATAQPGFDPLPRHSSPDSLAEKITREWPNVRLIKIEQRLSESLWMTGFIADIEKLEQIAEVVVPAPIPNFAATAIAAVQFREHPTFRDFKDYLCNVYPEYDCESDFDNDELQRTFTIALNIVEAIRENPVPLYLVTSAQRAEPVVNAVVTFDSLAGTFNVVSYMYPFPGWNESHIIREAASAPSVYPPPPAPFPQDLEILPVDSIRMWNLYHDTVMRRINLRPHQVRGFEFLWLHRKGEKEKEFGPVVAQVSLHNLIEPGKESDIDTIEARCDRAREIGLGQPRIVRTGRVGWNLRFAVENRRLLEETLQSGGEIHLNIRLKFVARGNGSEGSRAGEGNVALTIISDEPLESR